MKITSSMETGTISSQKVTATPTRSPDLAVTQTPTNLDHSYTPNLGSEISVICHDGTPTPGPTSAGSDKIPEPSTPPGSPPSSPSVGSEPFSHTPKSKQAHSIHLDHDYTPLTDIAPEQFKPLNTLSHQQLKDISSPQSVYASNLTSNPRIPVITWILSNLIKTGNWKDRLSTDKIYKEYLAQGPFISKSDFSRNVSILLKCGKPRSSSFDKKKCRGFVGIKWKTSNNDLSSSPASPVDMDELKGKLPSGMVVWSQSEDHLTVAIPGNVRINGNPVIKQITFLDTGFWKLNIRGAEIELQKQRIDNKYNSSAESLDVIFDIVRDKIKLCEGWEPNTSRKYKPTRNVLQEIWNINGDPPTKHVFSKKCKKIGEMCSAVALCDTCMHTHGTTNV